MAMFTSKFSLNENKTIASLYNLKRDPGRKNPIPHTQFDSPLMLFDYSKSGMLMGTTTGLVMNAQDYLRLKISVPKNEEERKKWYGPNPGDVGYEVYIKEFLEDFEAESDSCLQEWMNMGEPECIYYEEESEHSEEDDKDPEVDKVLKLRDEDAHSRYCSGRCGRRVRRSR